MCSLTFSGILLKVVLSCARVQSVYPMEDLIKHNNKNKCFLWSETYGEKNFSQKKLL